MFASVCSFHSLSGKVLGLSLLVPLAVYLGLPLALIDRGASPLSRPVPPADANAEVDVRGALEAEAAAHARQVKGLHVEDLGMKSNIFIQIKIQRYYGGLRAALPDVAFWRQKDNFKYFFWCLKPRGWRKAPK